MDNQTACKHDFRGVSYGNGPILECIYCQEQKLFEQEINERIEQQRGHYLYKRAEELDNEAKKQQLIKGAEKYPEPLEPDSWTALQGAQHAFQEITDIKHYVTLQLIKNERLEAENKLLKERLETLERQAIEDKKQLKELEAESLRLIRKAYLYGR